LLVWLLGDWLPAVKIAAAEATLAIAMAATKIIAISFFAKNDFFCDLLIAFQLGHRFNFQEY
jgi:hypothetical protein